MSQQRKFNYSQQAQSAASLERNHVNERVRILCAQQNDLRESRRQQKLMDNASNSDAARFKKNRLLMERAYNDEIGSQIIRNAKRAQEQSDLSLFRKNKAYREALTAEIKERQDLRNSMLELKKANELADLKMLQT